MKKDDVINTLLGLIHYLKWGKDAMQEELNSGRISSEGRTITGFSENGLKFIGYIDKETGNIANFYPTLN